MRLFSIITLALLSFSTLTGWETDFEKAKKRAEQEHKCLLLNFSGSDWCIPCIRMEKDIFTSAAFELFADSNLVLVHADFPRLKKNQLPKDLQKKNDKLADKFNPKGSFPLTVLLDEKGKVIRSWDGYPDEGTDKFIAELKELAHARH